MTPGIYILLLRMMYVAVCTTSDTFFTNEAVCPGYFNHGILCLILRPLLKRYLTLSTIIDIFKDDSISGLMINTLN